MDHRGERSHSQLAGKKGHRMSCERWTSRRGRVWTGRMHGWLNRCGGRDLKTRGSSWLLCRGVNRGGGWGETPNSSRCERSEALLFSWPLRLWGLAPHLQTGSPGREEVKGKQAGGDTKPATSSHRLGALCFTRESLLSVYTFKCVPVSLDFLNSNIHFMGFLKGLRRWMWEHSENGKALYECEFLVLLGWGYTLPITYQDGDLSEARRPWFFPSRRSSVTVVKTVTEMDSLQGIFTATVWFDLTPLGRWVRNCVFALLVRKPRP